MRTIKSFSKGALSLTGMAIDSKVGVPIGSVLSSLAELGTAIRRKFMEQKIRTYLNTLGEISDRERLQFMKLVDKDPEEFYQRLWDTLEHNDTEFKTGVIAHLTKALARRKIALQDYYICCKVVNDAHTFDLQQLFEAVHRSAKGISSRNKGGRSIMSLRRLSGLGITLSNLPMQITPIGAIICNYGSDRNYGIKAGQTLTQL